MAEQIKKEDVINDPQFIKDASDFLIERTGKAYTSREEIFENYLSHWLWYHYLCD